MPLDRMLVMVKQKLRIMWDEDLINHDGILVTLSVLIVVIRDIILLIAPIMLCSVKHLEVALVPQQYKGLR